MNKYINNISSLQIARLLRYANLIAIGIVFSHLFTVDVVGYYEKFIFVAGIVSFFWLQGIVQSFLSLVKQKNTQQTIYFNTFVLLIIFAVLTAILLLIFQQIFAEYYHIKYLKYLILYLLFSIPSSLTEYAYLGLNKYKHITVYSIASQSLHFILLSLPPILGFSLEYSLIGLIIVNIFRFIWLIFILRRYTICKISVTFIKEHLKLAYPLIISILLGGSASYIDGFLIAHFFNDSQFAIFQFGAKEFPISIMLINTFSNASIPEFAIKPLTENIKNIKNYSLKLMHFLFPLSIIMMMLSNLAFPILFSDSFLFSAKIFNIYLALLIFRILLPQTILLGKQKTKVFWWVSLIEIITNVTFSLVFIPIFGLIGVAYSTIIAYGVEKIILINLVHKEFGIKLGSYLAIKPYLLYTLALTTTYIITDYLIF